MPVGRSDGCLSTTQCHVRCVMVKTRLAQRSMTRDRFRARCTPGPESATRNGIHCTEAVCDARVGRSDGCLSTTPWHGMCVQKQRDRELNPGAKGQHVNKLAQ